MFSALFSSLFRIAAFIFLRIVCPLSPYSIAICADSPRSRPVSCACPSPPSSPPTSSPHGSHALPRPSRTSATSAHRAVHRPARASCPPSSSRCAPTPAPSPSPTPPSTSSSSSPSSTLPAPPSSTPPSTSSSPASAPSTRTASSSSSAIRTSTPSESSIASPPQTPTPPGPTAPSSPSPQTQTGSPPPASPVSGPAPPTNISLPTPTPPSSPTLPIPFPSAPSPTHASPPPPASASSPPLAPSPISPIAAPSTSAPSKAMISSPTISSKILTHLITPTHPYPPMMTSCPPIFCYSSAISSMPMFLFTVETTRRHTAVSTGATINPPATVASTSNSPSFMHTMTTRFVSTPSLPPPANLLTITQFIDNYAGQSEDLAPFTNANNAYSIYAGDANYDPALPTQSFYDFTHGDVAFFVMDTRRYRSGTNTTATERTMLGPEQLTALHAWLSKVNSTTTFKFIVSSVPFTTLFTHDAQIDTWAFYREEQASVLALLQSVPNVVVISGDRHQFAAIEFPAPPNAHAVLEVSTSPLSMFYIPIISAIQDRSDEFFVRNVSIPNLEGEMLQQAEKVPRERVLKYIPEGNYKWSAFEIDTRDPARPMLRIETVIDGKPAYHLEVVGTPSKMHHGLGALVTHGVADWFSRLGLAPAKWF